MPQLDSLMYFNVFFWFITIFLVFMTTVYGYMKKTAFTFKVRKKYIWEEALGDKESHVTIESFLNTNFLKIK